MRVIYPSFSASEYLGFVRSQNEVNKGEKGHVLTVVVAATSLSVLFFILVDALFFVLGFKGSFILALIVAALLTVLMFVIKPFPFMRPVPKGVVLQADMDMFGYYQFCDVLRASGAFSISLHLLENSCNLEIDYGSGNGRAKKFMDMAYHINPGINDVIVDFERREVSIPEKMYDTLEEK